MLPSKSYVTCRKKMAVGQPPRWPIGSAPMAAIKISTTVTPTEPPLSSFVLQRSEVPATDPAIESGIAWLKANQRRSGRWFSRSLYQDSTHYLSHAATAMAVMAIQSAEQ